MKSKSAFIYLKHCPELNLYKIGVSKNDNQRTKALQSGNPYEILTRFTFFSKYPYKVEKILHKEFLAYKMNEDEIKLKGEWFNLSYDQAGSFLEKCQLIEKSIDSLVNSGNPFILK